MTTWDEWFAYLDGLVDASIGGRLPDIRELLQEARRCRSELGITAGEPRARVLDELWAAALFLVYLDKTAAESHHRAASQLYSQGKEASWLPAALPNAEESRLVARMAATGRGEKRGAPDRMLKAVVSRAVLRGRLAPLSIALTLIQKNHRLGGETR